MRILASLILAFVLFANVGPPLVSAQIIYQPPVSGQLVPVTAPCPSIQSTGGTLQTTPWPYMYSACVYYGGRANVTVPPGMALEWRYYVQGPWWWPYQQEVTIIAYAGQVVSSDFLRLYYAPYVAYVPGQPVYPPGTPIYQPPPSTQPPTWPSPMPELPAPGTPVPSETRTGVGLTLAFGAGWPVAGWRVQYASGRTAYECYVVTAEAGRLTDGIINPNDGIARHAPRPCYFP